MLLLKGGYIVQGLGGADCLGFLLNETWGVIAALLLVWVACTWPKTEVGQS